MVQTRYDECTYTVLIYLYILSGCFGIVSRTSFALFSNASIIMLATCGATALLNAAYTGFANWNSIARLTSVCGIVGLSLFVAFSDFNDSETVFGKDRTVHRVRSRVKI